MRHDARGVPVATACAAAVAAFESGSQRLSSFDGDPLEDFAAASAQDPGWLLPHVARAGFLLTLTERALLPQARAALDAAQALAAGAPERERGHLAAAEAAWAGRWAQACGLWEALLLAHPCDHLALQLAHLFDFYRGDAAALRQRVARVLPAWPRDDGLRPYVLGMWAFGLEECGRYGEAEAAGCEAIDGGHRVPWAVHAVAHVREMQGRHEDGRHWLEACRWAWDAPLEGRPNGMNGHNGWHLALFHLEALDTAAALAEYDARLARLAHEGITLQRLDAAALLWRLYLLGVDVGDRWRTLQADWPGCHDEAGHYAFNDWHALIACVGAGDMAQARRLLSRARGLAGSDNEAMADEVGLPLMQAFVDFAEGRLEVAGQALYRVRERAWRFGGSHAQRDLIDQTLLACAARGAAAAQGRAVLRERLMARAMTPWTQHWLGRIAA